MYLVSVWAVVLLAAYSYYLAACSLYSYDLPTSWLGDFYYIRFKADRQGNVIICACCAWNVHLIFHVQMIVALSPVTKPLVWFAN